MARTTALAPADSVQVMHVDALGGLDVLSAAFVGPSRPHAHFEYEVGFVTSGERLVRCKGTTTRARPGDLFAFNPRDVHCGAPVLPQGAKSGASSTYRAFLIGPVTMESISRRAGISGAPWFHAHLVRDHALTERMLQVHERLSGGAPDPQAEQELAEALGSLVRKHTRPVSLDEPAAVVSDGIRRVREFIEHHYARPIRLRELADISGLGVFRLIRDFRSAHGLTPYTYLEQVRVDRAVAMLREGHPVTSVAYDTGFCDQSHMARFFKRVVGVPPGRYRRSSYRTLLRSAR